MSDSLAAGADRFSGFAALYDAVRPVPPADLGPLLAAYVGRRPLTVVDLGSGTGSSSRWASTWADEVVGVEPSDDMRDIASATAAPGPGSVTFRSGWSHATGLDVGTADVVIASQALHWMEPASTLAEVARCLRPGGVFAAIDCDWPPVVGDAVSEEAWNACRRRMRVFETRLANGLVDDELRAPVTDDDAEGASYSGIDAHLRRTLSDGVKSWSKSGHLERMEASGHFASCREIAMASSDAGDAERFVGLLRSQGDYQTLRRHGLDDDVLGVNEFADLVQARLGSDTQPWRFVYRARLGFRAQEAGA